MIVFVPELLSENNLLLGRNIRARREKNGIKGSLHLLDSTGCGINVCCDNQRFSSGGDPFDHIRRRHGTGADQVHQFTR